MNNEQEIKDVSIEYTDNEEAKEKFIKFMLNYFLDKDFLRKVDLDENQTK